MKILIDARPIQTYSKFRGIGRYVNQIIEIFKNNPNVYFLYFRGNDVDKRSNNRIIINSPRKGVTFSDKILLPYILKRHKIDVFHSTAFALPFKLPNIKYIITIHDLTPILFPRFSSIRNIFIFKRILRSAKRADIIISVSKNTMSDLIYLENIREDSIRVVYNPVNLYYEGSDKIINRFPDLPSEYAFYVGGFDGNKNVETLVKALNIFRKPLVLTGLITENQKEEFSNLLTNKSKNLLFFTGYVSDKELAWLYTKAKLFVFPSIYEGFGYPPLEALKNGTPSVVSDTGSLKEVLKDAAVYIDDPLNEKVLAEKINFLWNNIPLAEGIVSRGSKILEEYSVEKFKRNLEKIYFSLLEN